MISAYSAGDQFLRRWSVIVTSQSGTVLELSAGQGTTTGAPITNPQGQVLSEGLRIKWHTYSLDAGIPARAEIEVYNLSDKTAARVMKGEFSAVVLQAGYVNGRYGVVFTGTIKQVKRGRDNAVDTYLRIYAADGDWALTQRYMSAVQVGRGSDVTQRVGEIQKKMQQDGIGIGTTISGFPAGSGILPREKTIWNMYAHELDTTTRPYAQWSIQDGKLQVVPLTGYKPGEIVILNAHSGLIGTPEATQQGVFVTALLNPAVKVRTRVKINNADINTSEPAVSRTNVIQQGFPGFADLQFFASTADDGVYTVVLIETEGDSRGNPWYMKLVCLLTDETIGALVPPPDPSSESVTRGIDAATDGGVIPGVGG